MINWKVLILFSYSLVVLSSCEEKPNATSFNQETKMLDSILTFYNNNKIDTCILLGEKFIIDYPQNDKGWHALSSAYLKKEDYDKAEFYANHALELNPSNYIALLNKGILLDKKKLYDSAAYYYDKSIKINDNVAQTYSNYAGNRLHAGDPEAAVIYGEKAVELGNNISDKGILCLSYHESGDTIKRDSLIIELRKVHYKNIKRIEEMVY